MNAASPQRILVLHEELDAGARPDETDALQQVSEVSDVLRQLRCDVSVAGVSLDLAQGLKTLRAAAPDCVVNLVESLGGRGELIGLVPALLESAALPFTGSGSMAISLTSHKILAKRWMRLNGIPTPDWHETAEGIANTGDRWIVKSLWEHASLGLDDASVTDSPTAVAARMLDCARTYGGQWFAERYVDGREFNISLLEHDGQLVVLPLAEMMFVDYPPGKPRIVGYAAKWDDTAPEYHDTRRCFPVLDRADSIALQEVARQCWSLFGLRGYARVDVRLDRQGTPWVIEINANPCLAQDAGFLAAAAEAGLPCTQVFSSILGAAARSALLQLRRAG